MLKILYFAGLRERLGRREEQIELPAEVATVVDLLRFLEARGGSWQGLGRLRNLRCAVNQNIALFDAAIEDGDEVALFPPVTGG